MANFAIETRLYRGFAVNAKPSLEFRGRVDAAAGACGAPLSRRYFTHNVFNSGK